MTFDGPTFFRMSVRRPGRDVRAEGQPPTVNVVETITRHRPLPEK